jgi:nucleotide-binding universal stress UspA family protein
MTRKLERILIAIDESSSANAAIELGLAIAGDEGAYVIFAHVVSIAGGPFVPVDGKPDRIPERAQTELLVEAESRAAAAGIECATELLIGYPPKQIALLADELDVDLVVVGSRHLTGVKRFLLGSTSRALLGETVRPILVVPEPVLEPALT